MPSDERPDPDEIARRANAPRSGLLGDLWGMLKRHRKWWLAPVLVVLLLVGLLLVLGASPLGPFLYPLF
jgi:uncharacterized protein involved in exopolysaccharide biosynthesis